MRAATARAAATAAIAAMIAVVLALAGCAPSEAEPATVVPGGFPDGVTAELQQLRSDVAARQAQVFVTNGTDEHLVIGDLDVTDPRLAGPGSRLVARDSRIGPGATAGIRIQLPPVVCENDLEAGTLLRPTLTVAYTLGDASGSASIPIEDPLGFVSPLHERECRFESLSEVAAVAFTAFVPSPAGEPAALELTVTPTGAGAATISDIRTTNLLTFAGAERSTGALPLALAVGDTDPIVVELPLVPLRCDAHAVQEDKRGTIFEVGVVAAGEPGGIELAASDELRGRILTWVADWCGFGGS